MLVRLFFIMFSGLVLGMGDPSFLPGNARQEPDFPVLKDLKELDATIKQLDKEESQAQEEANKKDSKQQKENK